MAGTALRFSALFFLIALLTSRVTLVVHELVGHAAPAVLLGGSVQEVQLFWFAGGYVQFSRAEPFAGGAALTVYLGGVALEVLAGAAALLIARRLGRDTVARLAAVGYGGINLIHAGYYLSAGTFHGFGDGRALHGVLGGARPGACAALGAVLVAGAFVLARHLVGLARGRMAPLAPRRQLATVAIAIAVAAGAHAALSFGELALRRDRAYASAMQPESDRRIERELAARLAQQRAAGIEPDGRDRARIQEQLAERHRTFPLAHVLVAALALALAGGALTSRAPATARPPPTWAELRSLGLACGAALAAVIVLSVLW